MLHKAVVLELTLWVLAFIYTRKNQINSNNNAVFSFFLYVILYSDFVYTVQHGEFHVV